MPRDVAGIRGLGGGAAVTKRAEGSVGKEDGCSRQSGGGTGRGGREGFASSDTGRSRARVSAGRGGIGGALTGPIGPDTSGTL